MPSNQAFDSQEFEQLYLPYAPNVSKLAGQPLLVDGNNLLTTWGGTLKKRFPMAAIGPTTALGFRCDRLWVYETLELNPNVYIVGSFYDPTDPLNAVWKLKYFNVSTVNPVWIDVTEKRACNHSRLPHEGIVRRGILYIKSFPFNAGVVEGVDFDVLGSIALNGNDGSISTHVWGTLGPTVPAALSDPGTWSASTNPVNVLQGWAYTYTWVEQSGNESCRAPLETNVNKSPSSVGAFSNLIPSMTVVGPTDTSEFPFINIYRTTDGGGTFFFVYQMVNLGGSQTFTDSHYESGASGGTFNDPLPDAQLDTAHQAPTTTSNGPPPTTVPPATTGDDPILQCTRIVEYAGRLWYGINEYLFYSALEELEEGIPEECFPAGDVLPNFFRMPKGIASLESTPSGLLVNTRTETIRIEGTNRSSFNPRPFLGGVGGAAQQFRASTEAGEYAAWVTQDFRVVVVHNDSFAVLSNNIGKTIENLADVGDQIDIKFWAHGDKEWILIAAHNQSDPSSTRWIIYDMNLSLKTQTDYWFVPWSVASSAIAVGQKNITDTENKLWVALWDGTNMRLAYMFIDATTLQDFNPTTGAAVNYGWGLTTSLVMVPVGDHVNELRRPDFSPVISSLGITRKDFSGDADPTAQIFIDDLFTTPISIGTGESPARRVQSLGYVDLTYNDVNQVAKHVSLELTGAAASTDAELYALQFSWAPNSGA